MIDLLPLVQVPDERLRIPSEPIELIDQSVQNLVRGMLNTMYSSEGIGLAAIQVGVPKKIIVIDIDNLEEVKSADYPLCMINPEIVGVSSKTVSMKEGCLSVPGEYIDVVRPISVRVRYLNLEGECSSIEASGLFARVIQHEYDHLCGKLLIDYLPYAEKSKILKNASVKQAAIL